jgi:hypothetical protein
VLELFYTVFGFVQTGDALPFKHSMNVGNVGTGVIWRIATSSCTCRYQAARLQSGNLLAALVAVNVTRHVAQRANGSTICQLVWATVASQWQAARKFRLRCSD